MRRLAFLLFCVLVTPAPADVNGRMTGRDLANAADKRRQRIVELVAIGGAGIGDLLHHAGHIVGVTRATQSKLGAIFLAE